MIFFKHFDTLKALMATHKQKGLEKPTDNGKQKQMEKTEAARRLNIGVYCRTKCRIDCPKQKLRETNSEAIKRLFAEEVKDKLQMVLACGCKKRRAHLETIGPLWDNGIKRIEDGR